MARLMGEAILAFFGAPSTYEDDPRRAVRAGLKNQESLPSGWEAAGEEQEGEAVAAGEAGFPDLALEDDELLTEQCVLEQEFRLRAGEIKGSPESDGGFR